MKHTVFKWLAGWSLAVSQSVFAVPITDTVLVGAQEWAQVNLFTNVSWDAVSTQCPGGVCSVSSVLNGYDLAGWTWASIDAVQLLFNAFTGQTNPTPNDYIEVNSTWAPAFVSLFTPTKTFNDGGAAVAGWSSTPESGAPGQAHTPFIRYKVMISYSLTPFDTAFALNGKDKSLQGPHDGVWFVRDKIPVPAPATLALFCLGVLSMGITCRKRGVKV